MNLLFSLAVLVLLLAIFFLVCSLMAWQSLYRGNFFQKEKQPKLTVVYQKAGIEEIEKRLEILLRETREEFAHWDDLGCKSCVVRSDILLPGVIMTVKISIRGEEEPYLSLTKGNEDLIKKISWFLIEKYPLIEVYIWDYDIFGHFLGETSLLVGDDVCN